MTNISRMWERRRWDHEHGRVTRFNNILWENETKSKWNSSMSFSVWKKHWLVVIHSVLFSFHSNFMFVISLQSSYWAKGILRTGCVWDLWRFSGLQKCESENQVVFCKPKTFDCTVHNLITTLDPRMMKNNSLCWTTLLFGLDTKLHHRTKVPPAFMSGLTWV